MRRFILISLFFLATVQFAVAQFSPVIPNNWLPEVISRPGGDFTTLTVGGVPVTTGSASIFVTTATAQSISGVKTFTVQTEFTPPPGSNGVNVNGTTGSMVRGNSSSSGSGIQGVSNAGLGGTFTSTSNHGVQGVTGSGASATDAGVFGSSQGGSTGIGVSGRAYTASGIGVKAQANGGPAVQAVAGTGPAVDADGDIETDGDHILDGEIDMSARGAGSLPVVRLPGSPNTKLNYVHGDGPDGGTLNFYQWIWFFAGGSCGGINRTTSAGPTDATTLWVGNPYIPSTGTIAVRGGGSDNQPGQLVVGNDVAPPEVAGDLKRIFLRTDQTLGLADYSFYGGAFDDDEKSANVPTFAFLELLQTWSAVQTHAASITMNPLTAIQNSGSTNDIFIDGPVSVRDSAGTTQIRVGSIPEFPNGLNANGPVAVSGGATIETTTVKGPVGGRLTLWSHDDMFFDVVNTGEGYRFRNQGDTGVGKDLFGIWPNYVYSTQYTEFEDGVEVTGGQLGISNGTNDVATYHSGSGGGDWWVHRYGGPTATSGWKFNTTWGAVYYQNNVPYFFLRPAGTTPGVMTSLPIRSASGADLQLSPQGGTDLVAWLVGAADDYYIRNQGGTTFWQLDQSALQIKHNIQTIIDGSAAQPSSLQINSVPTGKALYVVSDVTAPTDNLTEIAVVGRTLTANWDSRLLEVFKSGNTVGAFGFTKPLSRVWDNDTYSANDTGPLYDLRWTNAHANSRTMLQFTIPSGQTDAAYFWNVGTDFGSTLNFYADMDGNIVTDGDITCEALYGNIGSLFFMRPASGQRIEIHDGTGRVKLRSFDTAAAIEAPLGLAGIASGGGSLYGLLGTDNGWPGATSVIVRQRAKNGAGIGLDVEKSGVVLDGNLTGVQARVYRTLTMSGYDVTAPMMQVWDNSQVDGVASADLMELKVTTPSNTGKAHLRAVAPSDITTTNDNIIRADITGVGDQYVVSWKGTVTNAGGEVRKGHDLYASSPVTLSTTVNYVYFDLSSGSITANLPVIDGAVWNCKVTAWTAGANVALTPASGNIDGSATNTTALNGANDAIKIHCDGTNFWMY